MQLPQIQSGLGKEVNAAVAQSGPLQKLNMSVVYHGIDEKMLTAHT